MRVLRSARAGKDVRDYYVHIGLRDTNAADRFIDAIDRTFARIAEHPENGSTRLWNHPALRSIRAWPVVGFEQFVVYYERRSQNTVRIVRVIRASVPPEHVLRIPTTS